MKHQITKSFIRLAHEVLCEKQHLHIHVVDLFRTFILNMSMIWSEGPPLNFPRSGHSCGRIKSDDPFQDWTIIVVGGLNGGGYLNNTEVLNKKTMTWEPG